MSARAASIPGESVGMVEPATTTEVLESLSGFVSGVDVSTVAVLVSTPAGCVTVTVIVIVAPPPAGMVPRLAVTVPPEPGAGPLQVPWLVTHEMKVVPGGRGSLTVTASASAGPALATRTP